MNLFESNTISIYGNKGKEWLSSIPGIIENLSSLHNLTELSPIPNMTYNYVATGYQNNQPIVLKLGLDDFALVKETFTLKAFENCGAVKVITYAPGMILLQQAIPGTTLKSYLPSNEDKSLSILCSLITKLHGTSIPKKHPFPHISDWLKILDQKIDIPTEYLNKARQLRDQLISSENNTVLLHGDLHHDNILQNGDDWLVIDPKGVLGDPSYEVASFIRNPIPELLNVDDPHEIIRKRMIVCAQSLDLPLQRIRDWFYVQIVLCLAWQLEYSLDPGYFKKLIHCYIH